MESVCINCDLGLKRSECTDKEYTECECRKWMIEEMNQTTLLGFMHLLDEVLETVFENKNVIYVSFFTERHEYALYEYFNELECFKKVFSLEMKEYKPFSVEIDFGLSEAEKDYMSLLPNLKFEREGKVAGEVIKIPEVYEDVTFLIKICSRRFISLTIFDENGEKING